ncbi:MAG: phenylalanine--tRNA ligase subunit beta [bacterium]
MIISYNWLKEYVDCSLSPRELAQNLTMSGQEVEKITLMEDDALLEIGVTPNRGDCLSVYGIARDLAACLELELKEPAAPSPVREDGGSLPEIKISEPDHCFRYVCRRISGVTISPSPDWLSRRLVAAGIRPVNNVVDVTNYILLEFGQPLHAFDYEKLSGDLINVRLAEQGEVFSALDGRVIELDSDMLVVADDRQPVALAGIIGGAGSEVSSHTTEILLEAACFNPATVRRSARRLGFQTESSFRFEREIDREATADRLARAVDLVARLCPEARIGKRRELTPRPYEKVTIGFRSERANQLLGTSLSRERMEKILADLGIIMQSDRSVSLPSWRPDLTREVDLIEEIARVYGYDNIVSRPPKGVQARPADSLVQRIETKARKTLAACGFNETINFSFTKKDAYYKLLQRGGDDDRPPGQEGESLCERERLSRHLKLFAPDGGVELVCLQNPLSGDHEVMRPDLLASLLDNADWNRKHHDRETALFEIGACYLKQAGKIKELRYVGGIAAGALGSAGWRKTEKPVDFFTLKGVVEVVLDCLGIDECKSRASDYRFLHKTRQANIYCHNRLIGFLGEVVSELLPDMRERVYLFQLELGALTEFALKPVTYRPVSRYPAVNRDLSVVVPRGTSSQEVKDYILEKKVSFLQGIELFDLFEGEQVGPGNKSLGFSLRYQSEKGTLTDDRVDSVHQSIILDLQERFQAHLRKA